VLTNTHYSAFGDGTLRALQMNGLKSILFRYYKNGDYVIASGDLNQCPGGFEPAFNGDVFDDDLLFFIDENYPALDLCF
jgi:hypothetical protein